MIYSNGNNNYSDQSHSYIPFPTVQHRRRKDGSSSSQQQQTDQWTLSHRISKNIQDKIQSLSPKLQMKHPGSSLRRRSRTNTLSGGKPAFSSELKGWDIAISSSTWSLNSQQSTLQRGGTTCGGGDEEDMNVMEKRRERDKQRRRARSISKADKMKWRHSDDEIRKALLWKGFYE